MKPSNTGIEWQDDRGISPEELAFAVAACDLEVERFGRDLFSDPSGPFIEYLDLCYIVPAIVRLAIAKYRKELAAKVARMDADTTDPEMMASEINYKDGWNDAIRTFRALLNENDHAE